MKRTTTLTQAAPPRRTPIRVAVVENNDAERMQLRQAVVRSNYLRFVGGFVTGEDAMSGLPAIMPDLVLMDVYLPGISGIECARRIRKLQPTLKVLVVTSDRDSECLLAALKAGADGYVTKPCDRPTLVRAVQEVMAGGQPISSDMTPHLVQAVMTRPMRQLQSHPRLSSRENEVMLLLAEGMENKDIAKRLGLSVFTVNAHLQSIYGKLNVSNRTEAIRCVVGD